MNPSNPLQTEAPEIGNDSYYEASAVSPNANHQDETSSLITIDRIAEPVPNAAQTLEDQQFEDPESQQQYLDCISQVCHRGIRLLARQLEDYSNEAHLFAEEHNCDMHPHITESHYVKYAGPFTSTYAIDTISLSVLVFHCHHQ
jgi:hypothetical protein